MNAHSLPPLSLPTELARYSDDLFDLAFLLESRGNTGAAEVAVVIAEQLRGLLLTAGTSQVSGPAPHVAHG